jgi:hypothetical protein
MNKTTLFSCLAATFMVFALPAFSQITIDRDDFPRMESFIDSVVMTLPGTHELPDEGPDQFWDYSYLMEDMLNLSEYKTAAGDPLFPDALNYRSFDFSFFQFPIPVDEYDGLDDEGWYTQGRNFTEVAYSIASFTGGLEDTLRFIGEPDYFDGRMNSLKFPVAFQNQWTDNHDERFNFALTVVSFGLNNVPGNLTRYFTQVREVVGYGQLVIPNFDRTPGEPMDALLIKVYRQAIDSVFLMGQPAPPALMNVFGLTQGQMASDSYYVFYRKDFGAPVLNIDMNLNASVFYRPKANDVVTTISERRMSSIQVFPNPVSAGQKLIVKTDQAISSGKISVTDISGRKVYQKQFTSDASKQVQIEIPYHLLPGIYVYTLQNSKGDKLGTGKLQVK